MINVLLFAHLQEEIGQDSLSIDCEKCTVLELKKRLQQQYPNSDFHQVMTAINEEFSVDEEIVHSGDTIAFLPPVSGG